MGKTYRLFQKYVPEAARAGIISRLPRGLLRKTSFSQCGEDILIEFVLKLLDRRHPVRYLDIGAHHPFYLSNTALFYRNGGTGVLVEPDPYYAALLKAKRPRDTVLYCGIDVSGCTDGRFFIMDTPVLNTFSRQEMERHVAAGRRLVREVSVEIRGINSILEQAGEIDFMSLDIEGLDQAVLKAVDWMLYRPACICVESVACQTGREPCRISAIAEWMTEQDYLLYADTFINSIFVDRHRWAQRWTEPESRSSISV